jgi:ATP-dependent RNA helicase RhlE
LTEQGIHSAAMHGNMSQSSRSRTLEDFKNGKIRVLVATDVAARGLDISNLPYVVNYDMPSVPEDYVHRIGRTGRAGVNGVAISLVSHDEKRHLQAVEKLLNQKIPVETVDGYTEDSVVPDYVLYRPNNSYSELTADKEIKEIVARRAASKQRSKERKAKSSGSGKRAGPKSTARKAKGPGSVKSSKMNSRGRKTKPVGSVKKRNAVKPQK